ncbi:hypothetical protein MMC26_004303 [Xylographa opegraphella]|nr:hypothetical protein [Xylographa opegraphella]
MSTPPTDDAAAAVGIHNTARAGQNLPALTWDDNLSHQATEYAKWLSTAGVGLQHSSGDSRPDQGENLFMEMGLQNPASAAAQSWINEAANYHAEAVGEGDFESYGHYSEFSGAGAGGGGGDGVDS